MGKAALPTPLPGKLYIFSYSGPSNIECYLKEIKVQMFMKMIIFPFTPFNQILA